MNLKGSDNIRRYSYLRSVKKRRQHLSSLVCIVINGLHKNKGQFNSLLNFSKKEHYKIQMIATLRWHDENGNDKV